MDVSYYITNYTRTTRFYDFYEQIKRILFFSYMFQRNSS